MWDRLSLVSPPAEPPITVEEAKAFLKVETSADDAVIQQIVSAATAFVDGPRGIGLALLKQTWRLSLDRFPWWIEIPLGPVRSVDEITYVDIAGDQQTLEPEDYQVDLDIHPARVGPAPDKFWPTTRPGVAGAVKVTFQAGHDAPSDLPADVRHALLMVITHLYEQRAPVVIGTIGSEIPLGVHAILERYRVGRFA